MNHLSDDVVNIIIDHCAPDALFALAQTAKRFVVSTDQWKRAAIKKGRNISTKVKWERVTCKLDTRELQRFIKNDQQPSARTFYDLLNVLTDDSKTLNPILIQCPRAITTLKYDGETFFFNLKSNPRTIGIRSKIIPFSTIQHILQSNDDIVRIDNLKDMNPITFLEFLNITTLTECVHVSLKCNAFSYHTHFNTDHII